MKKMILLAVAALALGAGCASEAEAGNGGGGTTTNDKVFSNNTGYTEYYKDEGNGKNYLYTVSEFDNSVGQHCTVVTADSEQTVAVTCSPLAAK